MATIFVVPMSSPTAIFSFSMVVLFCGYYLTLKFQVNFVIPIKSTILICFFIKCFKILKLLRYIFWFPEKHLEIGFPELQLNFPILSSVQSHYVMLHKIILADLEQQRCYFGIIGLRYPRDQWNAGRIYRGQRHPFSFGIEVIIRAQVFLGHSSHRIPLFYFGAQNAIYSYKNLGFTNHWIFTRSEEHTSELQSR